MLNHGSSDGNPLDPFYQAFQSAAEESGEGDQGSQPPTQGKGDEGTAPSQPAGQQDATGSGQTPEDGVQTAGQQDEPKFTQAELNRIVERRLERERRRFERRIQELEQRLQQFQQPQAGQARPAAPMPQQTPFDRRKFLQEFSQDPYGALRKFGETFTQEQQRQLLEMQKRIQMAAAEAVDNLRDKYEDFDQYHQEILATIQKSPSLVGILRRFGAQVTTDVYEDVLEQAYNLVKAQRAAQVASIGQQQQQMETQQIQQQKMRAGSLPQRAGSAAPPVSSPEDEEEALFQEIKNAARRATI